MNYYSHPTTGEHIRDPLPAVAEWATLVIVAPPAYDPQTQQCKLVLGEWVLSASGPILADVVNPLVESVDSYIAAIYGKFQRFDNEYKEREAAALAFKAAGYVGDASILITGFASNTGMTPTAATDLVLSQANTLRGAITSLGVLRMDKYLITMATTAAEAQAIHDGIIAQVDVIANAL